MDIILTLLLGSTLLLFWFKVPRKVIYIATGLALVLGAYAGIFSPLAVLSLLMLFITSTLFFKNKQPLFLGILVALFCWVLSKNWIPGILSWKALSHIQLSEGSIPFNTVFNYGKAFVGIALLLFMAPLQPINMVKGVVKYSYIVLLSLLTLQMSAFAFSYVQLDIKLPSISLIWLAHNFFFVCMPEEALFRGFIQKQLHEKPLLALAGSALLFGIYHAHFGPLMILYTTIAGLFYGWIWMKTQRLEASIALHFLVNATHFFFFSYPRAL